VWFRAARRDRDPSHGFVRPDAYIFSPAYASNRSCEDARSADAPRHTQRSAAAAFWTTQPERLDHLGQPDVQLLIGKGMSLKVVGFDEYERKARLTPGLLAIAPVTVLIVALGWKQYPVVALASGILVGAGATYLLAILVRRVGRRIESDLWRSWGGPPTTALLRTRSVAANATLRDTWRRGIEQLTHVALLPPAAEVKEPDRADELLEAAVRQVLHLGQDDRYPLLKKENAQYGFERNFYGIRWISRGIATACVAALAVSLIVGPDSLGGQDVSKSALVAGLVFDGLFLVGMLFLPSESRTREAADRYANQLLQAVVGESRRQEGQT